MDIKPKTVKWEVSNFSPGQTFDTIRCIKDRLGDFLSKNINRRSMVSNRTGATYKYTRTEGSKIYDTYILQIQKGSNSPCANGQSSGISLFGKNGRGKKPTHDSGGKENMGILFNQSHYTYCIIPAGDFKYKTDKASREMKNSSSEWILNKPSFQKLIQALPPVDVDQFASRLHHQIPKYISWQPDPHAWMVDAFQINWTPKSVRLPTFCSYTESVSQSNVGQVYKLIIITPV